MWPRFYFWEWQTLSQMWWRMSGFPGLRQMATEFKDLTSGKPKKRKGRNLVLCKRWIRLQVLLINMLQWVWVFPPENYLYFLFWKRHQRPPYVRSRASCQVFQILLLSVLCPRHTSRIPSKPLNSPSPYNCSCSRLWEYRIFFNCELMSRHDPALWSSCFSRANEELTQEELWDTASHPPC